MLFVLVNELAALLVNARSFRFTRRSFHRYETSNAGGTQMKKTAFLIIAALFCAGLWFNAPVSSQGHKEKVRKNANKIENNYIVVLDDSVVGERGEYSIAGYMADDMARSYRGKVKHVYKHALNGFSVEMSEADAEAMSQDYRVAFVEEDGIMTADATQTNPPWGLDRIDQRNLPLNATYNYNWTGSGVRVYIIDTGIRTTHTQFGGRASNVFDAFGGNGQDCNGHGTHVAGTVGGSTYGVAKSSMPRGVRVLDCNGSGPTSGVIAGVDWVRQNFIAPAVANMSLGGGASTALDNAVNNLSNAGVAIAVAAGNSNANACNSSPARAANAITTGSTTTTDARSSFSNFGTCLDIFAPGSGILSAWFTSNTATATLSGTSMASPHVAGVAALYKQANPSASATTIRNAIVNNATTNVVTNAGTGSPNRLLYSLFF
jgi:subtilisin family serine protease